MNIGDKVKIEGYGATFVIKFIYPDMHKTFYAVVTEQQKTLFETWLTEDKLELI